MSTAIHASWITIRSSGMGSTSDLNRLRKAAVAPVTVDPRRSSSIARSLRRRRWDSRPTPNFAHNEKPRGAKFGCTPCDSPPEEELIHCPFAAQAPLGPATDSQFVPQRNARRAQFLIDQFGVAEDEPDRGGLFENLPPHG